MIYTQILIFMVYLEVSIVMFKNFYYGKISFIIHNFKYWFKWNNHKERGIILTDLYGIEENFIIRSYFLNILAKSKKSKIYTYSKPSLNPKLLLKIVYRSFNVVKFIQTKLINRNTIDYEAKKIFNSLKDKKELLNLEYKGLDIGIDIYETYLRKYSKPTVILNDNDLYNCIKEGVKLVEFWLDFYSVNNITAVVISHDCYLNNNVPAKIAYKNNIPVYMIGSNEMHLCDEPFAIHEVFKNYRKLFRKLDISKQKEAIELAKTQLESRLKGIKGVDVQHYNIQCATPYHNNKLDKRVLENSDKFKVIILGHCFFDNPHSYEKMMFADFYEWLEFLVVIAEKTDYDWYIKLHPSALPGNETATKEIIKSSKRIKLIPTETPHGQLIEEGIDCALTLYGSVGHEYPLLGVNVVNCGYNPRSEYDFNWHANSIDEYEKLLLSLETLKKDIITDDIYEFYYMNHYYIYSDNLLYDSFTNMVKETNRTNTGALEYFLKNFSVKKHEITSRNIEKFILSGKKDFFINGPE